MAQIAFSGCKMDRILSSQLDMVPAFHGNFKIDERPRCKGLDLPRRRDISQKYGTGAPIVDREPDEWVPGLTRAHNRPTEGISTEQGPILLPFGENHHPEYFTPTVNTLNAVPFLGTKMNFLSDRYFK